MENLSSIPQSNVYALIALASFIASLLLSRVIVKIQKGEFPGGSLWVLYLRTLLGFILAAAVVFGYRCLMTLNG